MPARLPVSCENEAPGRNTAEAARSRLSLPTGSARTHAHHGLCPDVIRSPVPSRGAVENHEARVGVTGSWRAYPDVRSMRRLLSYRLRARIELRG